MVRVLLGRSDGSLLATPAWAVGCTPVAVATVSTSDRRVDLVALCAEEGAGARLLHASGSRAGAPLFDPPQPLPTGSEPAAVVSADFDGDGLADLAVANRGAGTVSVLWGARGGGFLPPVAVAVGKAPAALLALDVAGDSRPELLIADVASADVRTLTYDAAIGLSLSAKVAVAAPARQLLALPGGAAIAALGASGATGSLLTATAGHLSGRVDFPMDGVVSAAAALDIDADGSPELVLAQPDRGPLFVRSLRAASVGAGQPLSVRGTPLGPRVADVDGDGLLDVVWADAAAGGLQGLLGQGMGRDGAAGFAPLPSLPPAAGASAVAVGDLNGDRAPDLIAASPDAGTLSLILSVGPSRFQPSIVVPAGTRPDLIAAAEVTGDQDLDVIIGSRKEAELRVLAGAGNGTLRSPVSVPVGAALRALLSIDVDGDGRRDVVALAEDGVHVLRRSAAGDLVVTAAAAAGEAPDALAFLDANTDGVWDLAVASRRRGRVQLLLGQGDGRFVAGQSVAVDPPPSWLTAADANGN